MFKKLLSFLVLLFSVCSSTWASKTVNGNITTWDFTNWNPSSPQAEHYNITQWGYIAELDGLTLNPDVAYCNVRTDGSGYIALNGATIHVPVTKGDKVKFFYKSLDGNGGYTIGGNTNGSTFWYGYTTEGSGTYEATADGEITITSNNRYSAVTKIVLESPQLINDPNVVSFSQSAITAQLISLDVTEPTLTYPNGASVTFSSSNTKVAQVNASSGDVMMTNTGITTITATVGHNGQTYTASYTLTVESGAATYVINGDEFRFEYVYADGDDQYANGSGKLLDRVITGVEHITVEFGNTNETNAYRRNQTIVRNEDGKGLVATTLDANGWRHLWWNTDNGHTVPYQGTFYTFKPDADGTLVVKGYLNSTTQSASLVDATNNYSLVEQITTNSTTELKVITEQLTAGHTYYLYGDICNGNGEYTQYASNKNRNNWSIFELKSFEFNSDFRYANKSVILPEGQTTYLQSLNAPGATYSIKCMGDVAADFDTSNGAISNIRKKDGSDVLGGAIAVTATLGSGDNAVSTYYVLTIPYLLDTNHQFKTWRLDKGDAAYNTVNLDIDHGDALSMYYKVRRYDNYKNMTQCSKPVVSNDYSLVGDNAYYFGCTAGLMVVGNAQSFGANANVVNLLDGASADQLADVTWVDQQLKTMLNYEYPSNDVTNPYQITMNKNVTLKIPGLKAGQHVQIKWDRHTQDGQLGDNFKVTNAKDLDGTPIPSDQTLRVGRTHFTDSSGKTQIFGSEEFIVAADGDFEFHIADNGWVNIYEITISAKDVDIPSDIRLYATTINRGFDGVYRTISHDGRGTSYNFTTQTSYGGSRAAHGLVMNYQNEHTEGTVNCNLTTSGALTINSGRGIIKIVTRVLSNGYTVDKLESWVPIIIQGQTPHNYPNTWDFQNMFSYINTNMNACAGENVFWKKITDGEDVTYSYQVNAGSNFGNVRLCDTNDSQLYAHDQVIPDVEGLYFRSSVFTTPGNDKFIQINKSGLKVCKQRIEKEENGSTTVTDYNQRVVIPRVGNDQYVYIRIAGTDGSVTDTEGTDYTPYMTIEGDNVYKIQGNSDDLAVMMGDVTIKQIGVTNINKNFVDGYATESRDIAIDHSLTNVFKGDNVVAKYVSFNSYDRNSASVTFTDVATTETFNDKATHQVIPANTGVVLYCDGEENTVPFFVPAMRTASSEISGNMLAANVEGGYLSETMNIDGTNYTPFIFTKTYYKYSQKDGWDPNPSTADQYGYYRLAAKYGTYMSPNKSYLLVPGLDAALWAQSGNVKGVTILNLDDTALGIGNVASPMEPDVFYNMSGSKVTTPTQPGVYIFNGKKVMVK